MRRRRMARKSNKSKTIKGQSLRRMKRRTKLRPRPRRKLKRSRNRRVLPIQNHDFDVLDTALLRRAFEAGQTLTHHVQEVGEDRYQFYLNTQWNEWRKGIDITRYSWHDYCKLASHYAQGFSEAMCIPSQSWLPLPTDKKVAAVVTVMNEEATILSVIQQLHRLPLHELIVVVNGTTDNSLQLLEGIGKATIIEYEEPLGYDVGRAIGAQAAQSDILIFLDGDFPIFAEHLVPFIYEVDQGGDIVLNDISPFISQYKHRDAVTMMKEFLNRTLQRTDLKANSLTAIPHALSKHAVEVIGYGDLAIPPKAQAKAIDLGLSVTSSISVDVISANKHRQELNMGQESPVAELIIGDHIEALGMLMSWKGARLGYIDDLRKREFAGEANL